MRFRLKDTIELTLQIPWAVFSDTGWLRLVGSLKLQVPLAKEPYKRDYILPKRPVVLRSLLIVATPYELLHDSHYPISGMMQ